MIDGRPARQNLSQNRTVSFLDALPDKDRKSGDAANPINNLLDEVNAARAVNGQVNAVIIPDIKFREHLVSNIPMVLDVFGKFTCQFPERDVFLTKTLIDLLEAS